MKITIKPASLNNLFSILEDRNETLDTLRTPVMLNEENQREYYERISNRDSKDKIFAIEFNNLFAGIGGIENISWENSTGEISLIIKEQFRHKGFTERALNLIVDYAFNRLNLNVLYAEVYESNPAVKFWERYFKKFNNILIKKPFSKRIAGEYYGSKFFFLTQKEWYEYYNKPLLILDFGSGNTCKNQISIIKDMYDQLPIALLKKKFRVIAKWQLFESAGNNIPLNQDMFKIAYSIARKNGIECTASSFDENSDIFLSRFNIPFLKISANRKIGTPTTQQCILTSGQGEKADLQVVSKYPATVKDYEDIDEFSKYAGKGISDHTDNFDLYFKYRPDIYEVHYKLEDSTGLDAGSFARTPKQLELFVKELEDEK